MEEQNIKQIIEAIPSDVREEARFVRHYFYGSKSALLRLRTRIKRQRHDAAFNLDEGAMAVTMADRMNSGVIKKTVDRFETLADEMGLEYDGFEIVLGDELQLDACPPFDQYFEPATYVRLPLGNDLFGYLLFVGGNQKCGYIFECLRLVDDGHSDPAKLDGAPRLYRQPVQGVIDPTRVEPVGSSGKPPPRHIAFRVATGFPAPEEIVDVAQRLGIDPDLIESDWLLFLEHVKATGEKLRRGTPSEYVISFGPGNRVNWSEKGPIRAPSELLPMPFGTHATIENLRDALLGRHDLLALNDAVM